MVGNVIDVGDRRAVDDHRGAAERRGGQAELSHQVSERILAHGRVVVEFGGTGLVVDRCGRERGGEDLAADTATRLEDGRANRRGRELPEKIGREQATGAAANHGDPPSPARSVVWQ